MALCFGILGAFSKGGEHLAVQRFILGQFLPAGSIEKIVPELQAFQTNFQTINVVALSSLLITSLLLLNTVEFTLNQVWQVYEVRSITNRIAIFCTMILTLPALAVSGYYATTTVGPMFAHVDSLNRVYQEAVPFFIDFFAFALLFFLVPKAPVRLRPAAFGALISALLFGWSKGWFAWYIVKFSTYETVYGTIALVPVFLLWLYVAWSFVLFGAEVSYQSQNLPRSGKLWKRSLMTVGDGAIVLAIQALVLVVKAYRSGQKPPNEIEVAESLGCSTVVLKPTLDALERASIIMRGDGRDMPLLLMRSPQAITVAEIREALFKKHTAIRFPAELEKLFKACTQEASISQTNLEQLVVGSKSDLNQPIT